ncbi:Aldo/keto reductase [Xylariomycetidae sp. FL2044]|nr:Aldo/keto reductase [Xylariomycetidae sp. FL2044]
MSLPEIIAGSGIWGHFLDEEAIRQQMMDLEKLDIKHIDGGAHHPFSKSGLAERLMGKIGCQERGFIVSSKVMFSNGGNGNLTREAVAQSLDQTLASLKTNKVNIYFALAPDRQTPLEEQAEAFDIQYRLGKFSRLGVCNFQPDMLQEWIEISERKGYIKPSVFQGQYNLLCRGYETDLFPLLRKHGIAFQAFAVLAGGMLTGKVTFANSSDELRGTRFEVSERNLFGAFGRKWYDKPCFHNAIRQMAKLCGAYGVDVADAALRWAMHHSLLSEGDGIIIGPRNEEQLNQNITGLRGGPLPEGLVDRLNDLWDGVRHEALDMLKY